MSNPINLVAGDSGPNIILTLSNKTNGQAYDLTGFVSATLKFRAKGTTVLLGTPIPLTLIPPATNGQILLSPTTLMLTQPQGFYEGEIDMVIGAQTITAFDIVLFYLRKRF